VPGPYPPVVDLYPAIDLRHGRVVRLSQGEATRLTSYTDDPLGVAERFAAAGARWIHVVDLDRAFGDGDHDAIVAEIAGRVGATVRLQVGGGFRSLERIEAAIALPIARVVIGTAAVTDPGLVEAAVSLAGADRVAVGIDSRDGLVAVKGWTESSGESPAAVARRVAAAGVRTVIHTEIARDGMLGGPDVDGARALQAAGVSVIASGGIGTLDDVRLAAAAGLGGAIVGRALYEGRFTLADAIRVASGG